MIERLAVFDLDGTLLRGNISLAFGRFLKDHRLISWPQALLSLVYYLVGVGAGQITWLHRRIFSLIFRRRLHSDLTQWVERFITDGFHGKGIEAFFRPKLVQILQEQQRKSATIVLLSQSPDFLVAPLAHWWGIDQWAATRYGVDKEGRLCDIASYLDGAEKGEWVTRFAAAHGISKQAIWAWTDSLQDLSLLEEAGHCVLVTSKRRLVRRAEKAGWSVVSP